MQNENKEQHWKQKLEDVESLSSELRLDKSAAWEKLQHRLQQKPKRHKAILYWVSAACLLPLLYLLLLSFFQNNNNLVTTVVHVKTIEQSLSVKTEVKQKEAVVAKQVTPVVKKITKLKRQENKPLPAPQTEAQAVAKNNDSASQNKNIFPAIQEDSNVIKTAVLVQQKKRLNVVHINELSEPVETISVMAHNIYPHSFPLHFTGDQIEIAPLQTTYKTGFLNLKKRSSSN